MFKEIGFINVKTYIQSGNVLFESENQTNNIVEILEKKFIETFGFSSSVVLRTREELNNILNSLPFTNEEITKAATTCVGECLHVTMLKEIPSKERIEKWINYKSAIEEYKLFGKNIFFLFYTTIRDSKLANNVHRLDRSATTRNWKTIIKMFELANEMDEKKG
ncbi:MAG: hypothetical protein K0R71_1413 [Bacillales bacterium]|nr:hypothetical protein [Bacillales bacterium]